MADKKVFLVVLIKPSRYDKDGYVIQWRRSAVPSNSLATLYGLTQQCQADRVLGEDVEIKVVAYDETNMVIPYKQLRRDLKAADGGFLGLVGVQSNQFFRSMDIARQFRAEDIPVVIGGFHVGGCLSMLPEIPPEIQETIDMGVSIYAGEAEGRLDKLFQDVWNRDLKPIYNHMSELPDMANAARPYLPDNVVNRITGAYTSFDTGRGCPFQCSFCTIINVQGRVSRRRTADDIEGIVRAICERGIKRFFLTDDNFARNKDWEEILDRLIWLREEQGLKFKFFIQVDTLCHRIPNFIEKCARAGVHWVYLGLESINPEALMSAKKRQNKIWEYRKLLHAWKKVGVMTYVGYITGFPPDTPESIARDIEILKNELPVELVEFFCLTPLPGSEDHQTLYNKGVWMDPDLNKYELGHVVTVHPNMSIEEWQSAYRKAWDQYYTPEHIERIMRRAASVGQKAKKMIWPIMWFYASIMFEGCHPVEGGYWRYKVRTQRRSGLPIENPLIFYSRRAVEQVVAIYRWTGLYRMLKKIADRVDADPAKLEYKDLALTPTSEELEMDLEMMKVHGEAANTFQRANLDLHHDEDAPKEEAAKQVAAAE
ncbi:MAG: radical SAM protein [Kiloniellales bacterium]|nr:radical SAM protein [Kiloniellales bacterium]